MVSWTAFNYLSDNSDSNVLLYTRLAFLAGIITIFTLINFLARFPNENVFIGNKLIRAHTYYTLALLPLMFTPYIVETVTVDNTVGHINTGLLYPFFLTYLLLAIVCMVSVIIKQFRATNSRSDRQQIKAITLGVGLYSLLAILSNVLLPLFINDWTSSRYGPAFALIFVALVAYTIVKHRLFDIRLVVVRSLGYTFAIAILAVVYSIASYSITKLISDNSESDFIYSGLNVVLLLLFGVSFSPLKLYFDKITSSLFYKDAYDPQQLLDELNKNVLTNVDVEPLLNQSTAIVRKYLKASYCSVELRETAYIQQRIIGESIKAFSDDDIVAIRALTPNINQRVIVADSIHEDHPKLHSILSKYDVGVIVRLAPSVEFKTEGIGHMFFGIKKSGNPYSKQDTDIISIISSELTIATQNALRFEEIEKFNITLQEKVDDATRKLRKTNEKLQLLDETKDEFISMASHQLRTPLTSVKGYLSMVIEGDAGELTDMQRKLLTQSFISSQRMVFLIADLLNVSRLKTGKFVIEAKPTNLADIIQGEVDQLAETAQSRNLELVFDKPSDFPELMFDETKIRQVVMNFMDNAIHYTPPGGHIAIRLKQTDKVIEYTVADDGIGVPKSEQHNLFDKFFRAGNARKARPDGTGLGLYMAKKVVAAQGGSIVFKSEPGHGSTFGFTFAKDKLELPNIATTAEIAAVGTKTTAANPK